ncbi:MAG: type II toxin-antitoxin system RelE/ParE family toxin [Bacteroidota bacterium]
MPYDLSIASAAEQDIKEAFLWYEMQQEGLGRRFQEAVTQAIASIQSNPLKVQIRYGNTRVFLLRKFPYGVHFQVDKKTYHILLLALFHTAQNMPTWISQ